MTSTRKRKADASANEKKCATFACSECDKEFQSSSSRRTHEHDKHTDMAFYTTNTVTTLVEKNKDGEFSCPHCPGLTSFSGFQSIKVHARKTHPELPKLQPLHDKSYLEDFSLEDGSRLVLNEQNNDAGGMARFLRLAPAMLVAEKENTTTYLPMFINQESAPLVSGLSFTGSRIIRDNNKSNNNNKSPTQHAGLDFGKYAKVDEILGPFSEHGTDMFEFPSMLEAVDVICYAYSVVACYRLYWSTSKATGGGIINKLILGAADFNLLVTGGILLSPASSSPATVGPTIHPHLAATDLSFAAVYYRQQQLEHFEDKQPPHTSLQHLRQLTTSLHRRSTYHSFRANLLEDRRLQPATIFTLCDYPTRNFAMSSSNTHRLSSELFKLAALAATTSQSMLSKSSLVALKEKLENTDAVSDIFNAMQIKVEEDGAEVNVLRFFAEQKVTDLAQGMSSQLSNTNSKVEEYLAAQFQKLFV